MAGELTNRRQQQQRRQTRYTLTHKLHKECVKHVAPPRTFESGKRAGLVIGDLNLGGVKVNPPPSKFGPIFIIVNLSKAVDSGCFGFVGALLWLWIC